MISLDSLILFQFFFLDLFGFLDFWSFLAFRSSLSLFLFLRSFSILRFLLISLDSFILFQIDLFGFLDLVLSSLFGFSPVLKIMNSLVISFLTIPLFLFFDLLLISFTFSKCFLVCLLLFVLHFFKFANFGNVDRRPETSLCSNRLYLYLLPCS